MGMIIVLELLALPYLHARIYKKSRHAANIYIILDSCRRLGAFAMHTSMVLLLMFLSPPLRGAGPMALMLGHEWQHIRVVLVYASDMKYSCRQGKAG
jgi:hypothetical protein